MDATRKAFQIDRREKLSPDTVLQTRILAQPGSARGGEWVVHYELKEGLLVNHLSGKSMPFAMDGIRQLTLLYFVKFAEEAHRQTTCPVRLYEGDTLFASFPEEETPDPQRQTP